MKRLIFATSLVIALTGCASQISGLAPVGGDDITGVRSAAINVLLQNGVAIKRAPTCQETIEGYACSGSTTDDRAIAVSATKGDNTVMVVDVGGIVVYRGPVQDILDQAARATS